MEMHKQLNKPIFVVGSPRSGTSILSWCLGHHPNMFPVPESNWMGDFAVNLGIAYQIGSARGDYSILSAMDVQDDEVFAAFGRTINELIMRHQKDLEKKRETRCVELNLDRRWRRLAQSPGPKNAGSMERQNIPCTYLVCASFSRMPASCIFFAMSALWCARCSIFIA